MLLFASPLFHNTWEKKEPLSAQLWSIFPGVFIARYLEQNIVALSFSNFPIFLFLLCYVMNKLNFYMFKIRLMFYIFVCPFATAL